MAVLKRTLELPLYILSPELWWVAGSGSQGNPTAVYGLGYPEASEILVSNQGSNPVSSGLEGGSYLLDHGRSPQSSLY